jgi:hypothetical protein
MVPQLISNVKILKIPNPSTNFIRGKLKLDGFTFISSPNIYPVNFCCTHQEGKVVTVGWRAWIPLSLSPGFHHNSLGAEEESQSPLSIWGAGT